MMERYLATIDRNSAMSCLLGFSCTSVVIAWVGPGCTYQCAKFTVLRYIKAWLNEFAINGEIKEMHY